MPLSTGAVAWGDPQALRPIARAVILLDTLRELNRDFAERPATKGLKVSHFMDVFRQFAVHWEPGDIPPSGALDAEALIRDLLVGVDLPTFGDHVRRVSPALLDSERRAVADLIARPSLPQAALRSAQIDAGHLTRASADDLLQLVVRYPVLAALYRLLTAHARVAGAHLMLSKRFLFDPQRERDQAGLGDPGVVSNRTGTTGMDETKLETFTQARRHHLLTALRVVPASALLALATPPGFPDEVKSGGGAHVRFTGTPIDPRDLGLTVQDERRWPRPRAQVSLHEHDQPMPTGVRPRVTATGRAPMPHDTSADPRAALHVGPEQLLALIDHTSAVIYMRNVDGRYMLVNQQYERLFNVRREDIIGLTDHDLFPVEVADVFRANDVQAAARGGPIQVEETAPGPDGMHTYITAKFPLLDGNGVPYAICGISTDITERKRAEAAVALLNAELEQRVRVRTAELEDSTAELGAFAYSVSHDLRSPLRALDGYSQLLLDGYTDALDETGVAHLHRLQANANRMAQIIDGLLRLSRVGHDDLGPSRWTWPR